ncbi:tetratricopeptide repeat protein [Elusimicrobiota bacterium]
MSSDYRNYEKLKTLYSKKNSDILVEELKKKNIKSLEKHKDDTNIYEVWISADDMFNALGIAAEVDKNIKAGEYDKSIQSAKEKFARKSWIIKTGLVIMGIYFILMIGIKLNDALNIMDNIGKEIKPVSIDMDLEDVKTDFKRLVDEGKKAHKRKIKSKLTLSYLTFQWNLYKAEKAYKKERFKAAITEFEKCLKNAPENQAIISLLLSSYVKLNHYEEAKNLLRNSYDITSGGYLWKRWVAVQLSDIFVKEEDYFSAKFELEEILIEKPDDVIVMKKLAKIYLKAGELQEAAEHLKKVIYFDDKETGSRILLGETLLSLRRVDEVIVLFGEIFENLNKSGEIERSALILAEANLNLGRFNEADRYLDIVNDINDDSIRFNFVKAVQSYIYGNYTDSKVFLERTIEENPEFTVSKLYLSLVLLQNSDISGSQELISEIADICVFHEETAMLHYNMACLSLKEDRLNEAWDELMIAYETDPYLFKKFINDPLIGNLKKSSKYSAYLSRLE